METFKKNIMNIDTSILEDGGYMIEYNKYRNEYLNSLNLKDKTFVEKQNYINDYLIKDTIFIKEIKPKIILFYYDMIYRKNFKISSLIDINKIKYHYNMYDELNILSNTISEWCSSLELVNDLLEKYKIFKYNKDDKDMSDMLNNIKNHDYYSYFINFIKKMTKFSMSILSTLFASKLLSIKNISIYINILYHILRIKSVPWKFIMNNILFKYIFGYIFASNVIDLIKNKIDYNIIYSNIMKINDQFVMAKNKLDKIFNILNIEILHISSILNENEFNQYIDNFKIDKMIVDIFESDHATEIELTYLNNNVIQVDKNNFEKESLIEL